MTSCLGIYLDDSVIKYAKLFLDNNKKIYLKDYGIRFTKTNPDIVISDIIEETDSQNIPIVLNANHNQYVNFEMIENHSKKSYLPEILETEFEAWCEKNAKSPENYLYTYTKSISTSQFNKCNAMLDIVPKKEIQDLLCQKNYQVDQVYSSALTISKMVLEENYLLLNLDQEVILSTILNGQMVDIRSFGPGMREIIEKCYHKFGSYQKAYEACRQINVYSENTETENDIEVEKIVEPIIQEVIKKISTFVTKYKAHIDKIVLTGCATLFHNLDILLSEYFDLKCEILVPNMISNQEEIGNIAEIVEVTSAIAMAYAYLQKDIHYTFQLQNGKESWKHSNNSIVERKVPVLISALGITAIACITYMLFGTLYSNRADHVISGANEKLVELNENTARINEDIQYIIENREKYDAINKQVEKLAESLQENHGRSTYNVATFLQNMIRIIPDEVTLISISSDDNKNIKLIAESDSYPSLGYFISELKLEGTLRDIKINEIKNGEITTVEIGGELP